MIHDIRTNVINSQHCKQSQVCHRAIDENVYFYGGPQKVHVSLRRSLSLTLLNMNYGTIKQLRAPWWLIHRSLDSLYCCSQCIYCIMLT